MVLSNFPNSYDNWTTKVDFVDKVYADHVNKLQEAVANIEDELGLTSKGISTTLSERLDTAMDGYGNIVDWYYNMSGQTLNVGQAVVIDKTNNLSVKLSTIKGDPDVVGVVTQTFAASALGAICSQGTIAAYLYAESESIAIGDWLSTSSVPGFLTKASPQNNTFIGKSNVALTLGSSGIYSISVDIAAGAPLDENLDYRVGNFTTTKNLYVSGNMYVKGNSYITQTEIISGSEIIGDSLIVNGNVTLGNESTDETNLIGKTYYTYVPESTTEVSNKAYVDSLTFLTSSMLNSLEEILVLGNNAGISQINMNGNKITSLGTPQTLGDATHKYYVDTLIEAASATLNSFEKILIQSNSAGSSQVDMNNNKIVNVYTPDQPNDAANKEYVDTIVFGASSSLNSFSEILSFNNSTGSNQINMNQNRIINVGTVSLSGDAANKYYVDTTVFAASSLLNSLSDILILSNSAGSSQIDMNGNKIVNVATPTSSGDGVNKYYVDLSIGSGSGTGIGWTEITSTTASASANFGHIANNSSLVTITLPTACSLGSIIRVAGKGSGGWKIAQNASQTIHFGVLDTTTGTTGYLQYQHKYDAVELLCIIANTDFLVISSIGNIIVN